MKDTALLYPFPMHLSQGHTYHLSILQFLVAASKITDVYLLSLDSKKQIEAILEEQFDYKLPKRLNIITIRNRHFGLKSNSIFYRFKALRKIKMLAREYRLPIVYTRNVKIASFLFPLRKRSLKHLFFAFECHQLYSINLAIEKEFSRAKQEGILEDKVYANSDIVFVNTRLLKTLITKTYRIPVKTIPLGVMEEDIRVLSPHLSNSSPRFDFVYTGTFSHWKGVDSFLEALSILQEHGWKGQALLVGCKTHEIQEWTNKIQTLSLDKQVTLQTTIQRKNVSKLLDQCKIGVIPNALEDDSILGTSPLKLYDYAARGLHLVCSRIPPLLCEVDLKDLNWGEPDDPVSLATALFAALDCYDGPSEDNILWAQDNSWDVRAHKVLSYISSI